MKRAKENNKKKAIESILIVLLFDELMRKGLDNLAHILLKEYLKERDIL